MSELSKQRGRPLGTSPTAEQDDAILKRAALHMVMGLRRDFAKAVRGALEDFGVDYASSKTRLYRRWQAEKDAYLDEARREQRRMRWDIDRKALLRNQPRLSHIAETFASSPVGRELLQARGVDPSHYMSLGIVPLFELIDSVTPRGAKQAEKLFARACEGWVSIGIEPDETFFRRIAEIAEQRADAIAARSGPELAAGVGDL